MRGLQNGNRMSSGTLRSVLKVYGGGGGVGWSSDNRVSKVQDLRLKTLDLTLTLDLDFRLTINMKRLRHHLVSRI